MKNKKFQKKDLANQSQDDSRHTIKQKKQALQKIKYRHKNHWLLENDDEYLPNYKEEEE